MSHYKNVFPTSIVGIHDDNPRTLPDDFSVSQNYPNPFNPTTTIRYQLSVSSEVRLAIYNLLGQEVRALVNTKQSAGSYSVIWDGKDTRGNAVGSGVYIYRFETGRFVHTRKMILLR